MICRQYRAWLRGDPSSKLQLHRFIPHSPMGIYVSFTWSYFIPPNLVCHPGFSDHQPIPYNDCVMQACFYITLVSTSMGTIILSSCYEPLDGKRSKSTISFSCASSNCRGLERAVSQHRQMAMNSAAEMGLGMS
jgi:hypothetical protein